jgi:hypothetical protein
MSLRNGSAEIKFSEVLPIVKDNAVFNVSNYASKITGGSNKTKKRKYKGGNIPLVFSEFKTDTVITTENPIVIAALNGPTLPEITQTIDIVSNTTGPDAVTTENTQTPISTTPFISLGGGAAKRRSRKSKRTYKKGGKKSDKKSVKKSNKKIDKK